MAARWQLQEINAFTVLLSLPIVQFQNLCRQNPELGSLGHDSLTRATFKERKATLVCLILQHRQTWKLFQNPGPLRITHSESTQRDDRCLPRPNMPEYIYCLGHDPWRVGAMFFKCACLDQREDVGILPRRPCSLPSSCLGSDASSARPCEAQQTLPISPSRTETAGAFQELDLMRFHHQRG